jgi:hypothetical protein
MTARGSKDEDVASLLTFLTGKISPRKLRLFAVGCCQTIWPILVDGRSRKAIRVASRFADGEASDWERRQAFAAARQAYIDADDPAGERGGGVTAGLLAALAAASTLSLFRAASEVLQVSTLAARARALLDSRPEGASSSGSPEERRRQVALLRDIAGPGPLPGLSPAWITPTVRAIAQGVYLARDWQALPVLADALEEQGCDHLGILSHLRAPGPHARGCWALDLLLGKE